MTKLTPTVVANEDEVIEVAMDGVRRRPVCAINDDGELVVCCRRTAKKYGWKVEGALFKRERTAKAAEAPAPAKDPNVRKGRRATDNQDVAVVKKDTLRSIKAARTVLDASVEELLGNTGK